MTHPNLEARRSTSAARTNKLIWHAARVAVSAIIAFFCTGSVSSAGTLLKDQVTKATLKAPAIEYDIYLPDAALAEGVRLPVIYFLHGFGASGEEWQHAGELPKVLDRLIATGAIAPLIAVMPNAGKSWYIDSARFGGPGDYESAIVRGLVEEIDGRYPTVPKAASRGLAGISMGGYGALRLAFKHPEVFGAVAALSPGLFKKDGLSWQHGPEEARLAKRQHWYANTFGSPFDLGYYIAESPFSYAETASSAADLPRVLLAVGDDDFFGSYDGTVEMFLELRQLGQKPELRVGNGCHNWAFWRSILPDTVRFFDDQWSRNADSDPDIEIR
ncbi:alpha/beta hydrolase family protein [Roseibium sp. MMSF_3544]|uniref:alpha/beta hydrolase n=1 Tax=unclassified Roseibium TaxID=2629323 RepID=UPI00273F05A9|nr:alpha/beta hydrolase family protein [Roseibium sp. MMSF_3544]